MYHTHLTTTFLAFTYPHQLHPLDHLAQRKAGALPLVRPLELPPSQRTMERRGKTRSREQRWKAMQAQILHGKEPQSHHEAIASPDAAEWEAVMDEELESIARLGTYELVELPPGRKAIGTKWVYHVKRNNAGNVTRYKVCLCTQGFSQIPGVDLQDTYAPVASIVSIRMLCSMAATLGWEVHVVDVDSAFLNSEMPDDQPAYARQPRGYAMKGFEHLVWRLLKALYGLK
jgi:hypothetical protein